MDIRFFFGGYELTSKPSPGYCALYDAGVTKQCFLDENSCQILCSVQQVNYTSAVRDGSIASAFDKHICSKRHGWITSITPRNVSVREAAGVLGMDIKNSTMRFDSAPLLGWSAS